MINAPIINNRIQKIVSVQNMKNKPSVGTKRIQVKRMLKAKQKNKKTQVTQIIAKPKVDPTTNQVLEHFLR